MRKSFKATIGASCIGYVTQAILINFAPLLFITFQKEFGLEIWQLSILIASNFVTELLIDFICSRYVSKIGYRQCVIAALAFSVTGLILLPLLPSIMSNKFLALATATVICGIGGGMIEVLISPIVEACPTENKGGMMSLLHSFYCWGQMSVVLLSTVFFRAVGIESWHILSVIWAIVPAISLFMFCFVPINTLVEQDEESSLKELFCNKIFWILFIMMLCAGASEIAISQWASAFAEAGLGVEKWIGDLIGPCLFAACMGCARVFYSKMADKINLENGIFVSSCICVGAYLMIVFSPVAIISLIGCAVCGIGCGMLWPGSFSVAMKRMPKGGVPLFAMLAFAGDLGCLSGPVIAGFISDAFGGELKAGFLFAMLFPITLAIMVILLKKIFKKTK